MESSICSMCGEGKEITSHLFCTCQVAWLVWSKCYEWMGLASLVYREPKIHFSQFRLIQESEVVNQIWLSVWIAIIGELWKHRKKKSSETDT